MSDSYSLGRSLEVIRRAREEDHRYRRRAVVLVVLAVALVLALVLAGALAYRASAQDRLQVRVKDKQRVCESSGGSCRYLLYTDDGTFQITDSMWFWRFDSSDLYGAIDRGAVYDFKVSGWRLPFVSAYPNVLEAHPA
jgi:hypothetical protein